ncbi:MAG: hypothetical protein JNM89_00010 [Hyphomicrobiaceae bacterium]|nr:hypothetical protein [Hyphomicrobiaceae bacterium]
MPTKQPNDGEATFGDLVEPEPTAQDKLIQELQSRLASEVDARREERFVGIVFIVLLLDIVFFSVMPSFGGPIALLVLELLILIPLAKRMGMEEVAQILNRVLDRMSGKASGDE